MTTPHISACNPEHARRDVEACALQAQPHGNFFALFLPVLELLERVGDLTAAAVGHLDLLLERNAPALVLGCRLNALLGAKLAGQIRRQQHVDDHRRRYRGKRKQPDEHQFVVIHAHPPSARRGYRELLPPTGLRPGAPSPCSIRRVPRSAGGRCRSNGGDRRSCPARPRP